MQFKPIDHKEMRIRPHKYVVIAPILAEPTSPIGAIRKKTGKNTWKEYVYRPDVTIEKTSKSIIVYLKKRIWYSVATSQDVDKRLKEVKQFLVGKLWQFVQEHAGLEIDWINAKFYYPQKEIEVHDPRLVIRRSMQFVGDTCKKVYKNSGFEITDSGRLRFDSEEGLKRYVDNRVLENNLPRIEQLMRFIVEQQSEFAKNLELHRQVLQDIRDNLKKESLWQRLKNIFRIKSRQGC